MFVNSVWRRLLILFESSGLSSNNKKTFSCYQFFPLKNKNIQINDWKHLCQSRGAEQDGVFVNSRDFIVRAQLFMQEQALIQLQTSRVEELLGD